MSFPQGPILPFPWGADGRREEGQASGMILRTRTCARRLLCVGFLVSPKASLSGTDAGLVLRGPRAASAGGRTACRPLHPGTTVRTQRRKVTCRRLPVASDLAPGRLALDSHIC